MQTVQKPDYETKFHDFELNRAAEALFEAGRQASHDFLLFIALLVTASLLSFSSSSPAEVEIPALGLSMSIIYAAEIFLVLAAASFYRSMAAMYVETLLGRKVRQLMDDEERPIYAWHLYYPSLWNFVGRFSFLGSKPLKLQGIIINGVFGLGAPIWMGSLAFHLGRTYSFSGHWLIAAILVGVFVGATWVIMGTWPSAPDCLPNERR